MEFNISKAVEEIVMQVKENQEEFIFETIRPYCENILQMKINKEELKQILLNGVQKASWIPCSEKNPNETGEYFTTIKWLDRENVYRYVVVKRDYFAEVDTWNDSFVIAWMPLPEPYKESEE